ncbi:MAG: hypothetical protein ABEI96_05210 [Haloarculaceae archaeon]
MYDRGEPDDPQFLDRWDGGVGWIAHPDEGSRRASYAVRADDGVWLFDPLDAPGVDDRVTTLGDVAGVAVCSNWHARDAGAFARRYDVAVHVPAWMTRVADRVDAPVERYREVPGNSGFRVRRVDPLPGWREGVAYREADGTLYAPDVLTALPDATVGDERVGLALPCRLFPPREQLCDCDPERILVGHGSGVFRDADDALANVLDGARWRVPRALVRQGPTQVRGILGAVLDR